MTTKNRTALSQCMTVLVELYRQYANVLGGGTYSNKAGEIVLDTDYSSCLPSFNYFLEISIDTVAYCKYHGIKVEDAPEWITVESSGFVQHSALSKEDLAKIERPFKGIVCDGTEPNAYTTRNTGILIFKDPELKFEIAQEVKTTLPIFRFLAVWGASNLIYVGKDIEVNIKRADVIKHLMEEV